MELDMMKKAIIGITMGDAAGIGPEIITKVLKEEKVYQWCSPLVIGDADVMRAALKITGLNLDIHPIETISQAKFQYGILDVLDFANIDIERLRLGQVDEMCGKAAVIYTQKAVKMALDNVIQAMVSAPLNKESMRKAGYNYEGQTQIIGELTDSKKYSLMLILDSIRLLQVTTHVPLGKVSHLITRDRIFDMIIITYQSLKTFFRIQNPLIAVSAFNPHGGEGGLFGREEIDKLVPAIQAARKEGVNAIGPIPADSIFVRAKKGEFDAVLALYHDQANIAIKLMGFGSVVTLVVGVPIIRTSVGHGTAFDIAGKNLANHRNLLQAVELTSELAKRRLKS
jgi:4-hydroxythreonine-4-phosphate dehydrogenase